MPGVNLTRVEAEERFATVSNPRYWVNVDLTKGDETFVSHTKVTFDAVAGRSTFLDLVAAEVRSVRLNGKDLDPKAVFADSRIQLDNLEEHNEVEVDALAIYSHTGEGLHRSVDPTDGNVYLYTQFEVPDARRVYSVFDQPDLKAVFSFTVTAPESWTVLSIMPGTAEQVEGETEEGTLTGGKKEGIKRWTFEDTPKMSSYLTAIIAGPYASWHTEYNNEDGRVVPMGIYTRQSLKAGMDRDAQYLFDVTKAGFAFYAKTWNVPYPYAKYDQIFVPEYNAGAMENIGTVTIRDQYVFQSKVTDALVDRRDETILHELAHMWFGDLVTMKWWNDLWLNESFAEFMSTLCTAEATQWKSEWATFTSGEKSWGQAQDQLPTTHPVVAEINDLHDTEVNFDGITYAKGGSLLKQLMAYVGRDKFFEGIHNYLVKYQYSNATLADLLAELEKTSGRDMKAWSEKWLETSGVNTLHSLVETDENGVITEFEIRQTADVDHPTLRPHRLRVGFYNMQDGSVVRTSQVELDIDGACTKVPALVGQKRPDFILLNDDDLTYAKLRFDEDSLNFLVEHLTDFADPEARATSWLALWDMTRDAELPAKTFVQTSLKALATETQSTTFRYALSEVQKAAAYYVAPSEREMVLSDAAREMWRLALLKPGSDEQFQLVGAWLSLAADPAFAAESKALLAGTSSMKGLEVDNNMRWSILRAQARVGLIGDFEIEEELAKNDTTENREFAMGARAAKPTPEAKAWAWDEALHDSKLTNAQIGEVVNGFSSNSDPKLYAEYVDKFFDTINWIWENKSFHMAENIINPLRGGGLYPHFAEAGKLVEAGNAWLDKNPDAARALRRMVLENLDGSRRDLRVRAYNTTLDE